MADFNDSELFAVFDKASSSGGERKKRGAKFLKRKRVQEPTADAASNSKRAKKGPQRVSKVKPQDVVVIKDSSDELEESNGTIKPTEHPAAEKTEDNTDG